MEIPKDPRQELEELQKQREGITMWNDITTDDRRLLANIDERVRQLNELISGKAKEVSASLVDNDEKEAETQDPEGWVGDWKAGERPYGYVKNTKDKKLLEQEGFDLDKALLAGGWTQATMDDFNRVVRLSKTGRLSANDLKKLLEYNKDVTKAVDGFKVEKIKREFVKPKEK